jgi:hypothetical protein
MSERVFTELRVRGPANAAILMPLPKGPYFLVKQTDLPAFEKNPTSVETLKTEELFIPWAYAAYVMGSNFEPLLVGYHYDTSD